LYLTYTTLKNCHELQIGPCLHKSFHGKLEETNFPYAIQLRCFIHFRKNGFSSVVLQEFLDDIFGKHINNSYQEGLVDCCSSDDFDQRLSHFENMCESAHLPTTST